MTFGASVFFIRFTYAAYHLVYNLVKLATFNITKPVANHIWLALRLHKRLRNFHSI
jgi:hypothetical protein